LPRRSALTAAAEAEDKTAAKVSLTRIIEDVTGRGGAAVGNGAGAPVSEDDAGGPASDLGAADAADAAAAARPPKQRKPIGFGRRSRRARRDPQEPLNPRSAYTIFVKERMEQLGVHIRDTPDLKLKGRDQIKVVAQQWRDLSTEEKERYSELYKKAMEQYEKDLAAYKQTDSYRAFQEKLKAQTAKAAQQQADRPSTSAPTAAKQLKKTANLGAAAAVPSAVVKQPKQEEVLQQQQQPQQLLHQQQPMMIVSQHQQQQQFLQPMQLQQLPAQYQLQQQQPMCCP
ncbi:hypothetical protein BOX15_Mlig011149g1, partial [Macrostomum lignano]